MGVLEGVALASLIGGTALQVGGNFAAANAQQDAALAEQKLKNQQADELLSRQAINEQIMRDQAERLTGNYVTAFSSSGRGGGSVGGALRIKRDVEQNIILTRREAEFKSQQLRAGAQIESDLASSGLTAAWLGSAGAVLGTGAAAYKLLRSPSKPQELGKPDGDF